MNYVDIIIGVLLIWGLIQGLRKGLLMEVASLIALVAGIFGAIHFSHFVIQELQVYLSWDQQFIEWTGYALTFILIVVVLILVGKLLTKLVKFVALNLFNRLLGGVFGLAKVAFLCSVLLMFINSFDTGITKETQAFDDSYLYNFIEPVGPYLLPQILEEGRELSTDFDEEYLEST